MYFNVSLRALQNLTVACAILPHSFQQLVNGPPEAFLEAEGKKATEIKDHKRAIRCGVKRKDLTVGRNTGQFAINRYVFVVFNPFV
jgi:hypothetical protein